MFMEMENIVFFLKACEQFGLHETQLFSCAVRLHRRHHRPAALVLTSSVCVYVCVRALDGPPPGSPLGPRLANSASLSLSFSRGVSNAMVTLNDRRTLRLVMRFKWLESLLR